MSRLVRARAAYPMIPGAGRVEDFAMIVESGRIVESGPFSLVSRGFSGATQELDATIAPGLVNAHVHLEMAHTEGRTRGGEGFTPWLASLLELPLYEPDEHVLRKQFRRLRDGGTCFVGDISTRNAALMAGYLEDSGLSFVSFQEAIGFTPPPEDAPLSPEGPLAKGRFAAAAHGLASTHGETIARCKQWDRERGLPFSIHLAENDEELDRLHGRPSPLTDLMRERGFPVDRFTPPLLDPVPWAEKLGILDRHTLAVHCVKVTDDHIRTLADTGANVCLCPRSNDYIGEGRAPWEAFMASGVNLCLGTDGLCSNSDMDLYAELDYFLDRFAGPLSPEQGLALVTANPARAMGVDDRLGTLAAGRLAVWSEVPERLDPKRP